MSGFEHDFLNFNFLAVPHFRQNLGASAHWLQAMDQAATERALALQFCMALPSDLMQSLELPGATTGGQGNWMELMCRYIHIYIYTFTLYIFQMYNTVHIVSYVCGVHAYTVCI